MRGRLMECLAAVALQRLGCSSEVWQVAGKQEQERLLLVLETGMLLLRLTEAQMIRQLPHLKEHQQLLLRVIAAALQQA